MRAARSVFQLKSALRAARARSVGFVPTMGDLHAGHAALIRRSRQENDFTVLSIFVNPAQFDQESDFQRYHRDQEADLQAARKAGVDLAFLPDAAEMYPPGFQTWVDVESLSRPLCGASRPGHFRGVATVVAKLFALVRPRRAYFGLKDYQQFKVVERMARDLQLPVEVVPCPTVRESDGLALSSRNRRLSAAERARAARIIAGLRDLEAAVLSGCSRPAVLRRRFASRLDPAAGDRIDYIELADPETLQPLRAARPPVLAAAAVWIGKTRLIDNLVVG